MNKEKKNIFLIGFMGAGKSTIARAIKQKLGYPVVEMDERIVKEQGMPISKIFETYGELYFRELETKLIQSLKEDEPIVYRAWSTYSGEAGVDIATGKESRVTTIVKVAVAELTVSRLVLRDWSLYSRPMLIIRTTEGKLVASIPIIDYALLVKGNYNRKMSDQEYLDRQDEYNMTFFLDEQNQWINSVILINSWRVVLSNVDVD